MGLLAGLLAGSAIIQGFAGHQQGRAQKREYGRQSKESRYISKLDEEAFRRNQSRLLGERIAASGRSGIDMSTGSPLKAMGDYAAEVELNALKIRAGGEATATALERAGSYAGRAGQMAMFQGFTRAGASLLTGFSDFNDKPSPQQQWT